MVCNNGYVGPGITYTCNDGVWDHVSADNPTGKVGSCNCKFTLWYFVFLLRRERIPRKKSNNLCPTSKSFRLTVLKKWSWFFPTVKVLPSRRIGRVVVSYTGLSGKDYCSIGLGPKFIAAYPIHLANGKFAEVLVSSRLSGVDPVWFYFT